MDAHFSVNGQSLIAGVFPDGHEGDSQKAVSISYAVKTLDERNAINDQVAQCGAVMTPFSKTFWSLGFGMLKDRFGTHWIVSILG